MKYSVVSWIALMGGLIAGCHSGDTDGEIGSSAVEKIVPASVSTNDAWRLFDRSIWSWFAPTKDPVTVRFAKPTHLSALKVFGPTDYRVTLRAHDAELARVDLTRASNYEWRRSISTQECACV